jgi:glycine hydroxymethyltransferase
VVNAQVLANRLITLGYAIVSGGTDSHLMLVDLRKKNITGKDAEILLDRAAITVNKNTIPGDPQSPFVTSGIRIGTPAITTRGFGQADAALTATLVCDVLDDIGNAQVEARVRERVGALCGRYPVYAGL